MWTAIFLLGFLITGLAWSGIWGEKMVQAWDSFPAGKWGNPPAPVSDQTYATLNNAGKEVPWALEKKTMPASDPNTDEPRLIDNPGLDDINQFARKIGFDGRYQLNLPKGETGVWTISQDSISSDSPNPTADRTVHIDRYNGKVLADIRYADYSVFGKFMALGIALHMGTLGWWSILANIVLCLMLIFIAVSGVVMWWKRRPQGKGLSAPDHQTPLPRGALVLLLILGQCFPTAGAVMLAVLLLDRLVITRCKKLQQWLY